MAQPRRRLPGLGRPRPDRPPPSARLVLLASDGATSTTVAHEQLGRLRRLGVTPTLATVTMGGNDLLAAYGDAGAAGRAITTVVGTAGGCFPAYVT